MRKRTRGREIALKMLYRIDLLGEKSVEKTLAEETSEIQQKEVKDFASDLVRNVWGLRKELDSIISRVAENWEISRMAIIDRNILRIGAYELLHSEDVPNKVAINEAIELAKKYSTEDSGAFVNGILDKIREERDAQEKRG